MSLGKQAAQGAAWNYAAFLLSKGLLFVATLILARLLSPEEFGLVGMALLVITVLEIFRDFGIGASLIYRQSEGDREAAANVAFWLSAGIGVGLFALNWLLAPITVGFFKTGSEAGLHWVRQHYSMQAWVGKLEALYLRELRVRRSRPRIPRYR